MACFDAMGAILSIAGAWLVWTEVLGREFLWWHGALLVALGVSWVASLARSRVLNNRLRRSLLDDVPLVLNRVLLVSMVVALGFSLVWLDPERGTGLALVAAALAAAVLTATRGLAYAWIHYYKGSAKERVVIIGAGNIGMKVARLLSGSHQPSIEVVGFLDKEPLARPEGEDEGGLPVLGSS